VVILCSILIKWTRQSGVSIAAVYGGGGCFCEEEENWWHSQCYEPEKHRGPWMRSTDTDAQISLFQLLLLYNLKLLLSHATSWKAACSVKSFHLSAYNSWNTYCLKTRVQKPPIEQSQRQPRPGRIKLFRWSGRETLRGITHITMCTCHMLRNITLV